MTMTGKATFKQAAFIWKLCGKYGNSNADWAGLAKSGELSKETASCIISAFRAWEASPMQEERAVRYLVQAHIPGFTLIKMPEEGAGQSPKPAPDAQPQDGALEQLLNNMESMLNPQAVAGLREALEKEVSAAVDAGIELLDEEKKKRIDLEREVERLKEHGAMPQVEPVGDDYIKHREFDTVACLVGAGQNVLLTGPAGTGKSRMAREVALSIPMPYEVLSLGGGMRYSQIYGSTQVVGGDTKWTPGPLLQWVQKPCVVILEEVFGADPDVILGMNQLLERSVREISTPAGVVEVHPECRFIACANTTGRSVSRQYTGAQRADDSFLSRFGAKVFIDYDQNVEQAFLGQVKDKSARTYFHDALQDLRAGLKEHNIPFDAGTRELISAIDNYSAGIAYKKAFEVAFLGGLSGAERAKIGEIGPKMASMPV